MRTWAVRRDTVNTENLKVEWLWEPYIPVRFCSLIGADGGTGKSTLALWITKQLAMANLTQEKPVQALYVDFEGMMIDLMTKAKEWNIPIETPVFYGSLDEGIPIPGPANIDEICLTAEKVGAKLIIIDSWGHYAGEKDCNKQEVVLKLMSGLQLMARKLNAAVLILAHTSKGMTIEDRGPHQHMIRGSGAIVEQSRSVMILEKATEGFYLHHVKSNLSACAEPIHFIRCGSEPCIDVMPSKTLEGNLSEYRKVALRLAKEGSNEKAIRQAIRELPEYKPIWGTRAIEFLKTQGYKFEEI